MPLDKHLVVHLQMMYATERDYQGFLCSRVEKCSNNRLKSMLNEQIDHINQQMDNLQRCLSTMRAKPQQDVRSPFVQALNREDRMTMEEMPDMTPADMDVHLAFTDLSVGQMEIGIYKGMVAMARQLEKNDIVDRLQQNLEGEQADVRKMDRLLSDLISTSAQGEQQPQTRMRRAA